MKPIEKMLVDMARFYEHDLDKRQLEMYTEVLSQFPEQAVLQAGREYVRSTKNTRFPIPPHKILEQQRPDADTLAVEAAARAIAAVSRFGWNNEGQAREYVGKLGWRAITRIGGWQYLCQNLGVTLQVTTMQAQIRDLCKATIRLAESGVDDQPISIPGTPGVEIIGDPFKPKELENPFKDALKLFPKRGENEPQP